MPGSRRHDHLFDAGFELGADQPLEGRRGGEATDQEEVVAALAAEGGELGCDGLADFRQYWLEEPLHQRRAEVDVRVVTPLGQLEPAQHGRRLVDELADRARDRDEDVLPAAAVVLALLTLPVSQQVEELDRLLIGDAVEHVVAEQLAEVLDELAVEVGRAALPPGADHELAQPFFGGFVNGQVHGAAASIDDHQPRSGR